MKKGKKETIEIDFNFIKKPVLLRLRYQINYLEKKG